MNNFTSPATTDGKESAVPKHLESLTTSIFQSLFPAISPQTTPLSSIRRVLLLNRELPDPKTPNPEDEGAYILNLRHYTITTPRAGVAKSIRRINAAEKMLHRSSKASSGPTRKKGGMPNLGSLDDVADYLLDPTSGGFTSGSDSEPETDAEVEVLQTAPRRVLNNKQQRRERDADRESRRVEKEEGYVEKRAVKLVEIGPRMKLRLMKVEEGVCSGKVLWHQFVKKTKEEEKDLESTWEQRRKEKEERKRVQKENVEAKKKAKGGDGEKDEDALDDDEWDSEGFENDDGDEDADEMDVDGPLEVPAG